MTKSTTTAPTDLQRHEAAIKRLDRRIEKLQSEIQEARDAQAYHFAWIREHLHGDKAVADAG